MKKILFVCTGNTCRSNTAQGIFNNLIKDIPHLADKFVAESAGLSALDGEVPSSYSVNAAKSLWNYDFTMHKARKLTKKIIEGSDLVLTMTASHKNYILAMFPNASKNVFTLGEYVTNDTEPSTINNYDVPDPWGHSQQVYNKCAVIIRNYIEKLIEKFQCNL